MNMVTLTGFLGEELNSHTRDVILNTIHDGRKFRRYKVELTFNRYSLEIIFPEDRVTVYDDVFTEDEPLILCLDYFLNTISKDD